MVAAGVLELDVVDGRGDLRHLVRMLEEKDVLDGDIYSMIAPVRDGQQLLWKPTSSFRTPPLNDCPRLYTSSGDPGPNFREKDDGRADGRVTRVPRVELRRVQPASCTRASGRSGRSASGGVHARTGVPSDAGKRTRC
ncbi:hypothetical protein LZ30DRAFT_410751 [Colletotrichum cereale]|nr:hypothetical protein LZ30DRAFT_410751 [Colletotrichum cereale]